MGMLAEDPNLALTHYWHQILASLHLAKVGNSITGGSCHVVEYSPEWSWSDPEDVPCSSLLTATEKVPVFRQLSGLHSFLSLAHSWNSLSPVTRGDRLCSILCLFQPAGHPSQKPTPPTPSTPLCRASRSSLPSWQQLSPHHKTVSDQSQPGKTVPANERADSYQSVQFQVPVQSHPSEIGTVLAECSASKTGVQYYFPYVVIWFGPAGLCQNCSVEIIDLISHLALSTTHLMWAFNSVLCVCAGNRKWAIL